MQKMLATCRNGMGSCFDHLGFEPVVSVGLGLLAPKGIRHAAGITVSLCATAMSGEPVVSFGYHSRNGLERP